MTLSRFPTINLVTSSSFSQSTLEVSLSNYAGRDILARLQTATSFLSDYCIISVHRFELLMTPKLFWFDFLLALSLYNMYGVPVSIWLSIICIHNDLALIVCLPNPSFSYFSYKTLNSSPYTSANPLAVSGQNKVQFSSFLTLDMNRSGIHSA